MILKLKWSAEFYLHLALLIAALVVIGLSFSMKLVGTNAVYLPGASVALPESCSSRVLFGIPCPGCGLTRAFISISRGEFANAWAFNPASFMVYLFVLIQIPWQAYQMRRIHCGLNSVDDLRIYLLPIGMAILLILQWILRFLIVT